MSGCQGLRAGRGGDVPAGARALPEAAAMSPGPVGLRAIMESYAQRGNFMVCKLHLEKAVHIGKKQNSLFLAPSTRDGAQVRLLAPTSRLPSAPPPPSNASKLCIYFCFAKNANIWFCLSTNRGLESIGSIYINMVIANPFHNRTKACPLIAFPSL